VLVTNITTAGRDGFECRTKWTWNYDLPVTGYQNSCPVSRFKKIDNDS